VLKRLSNPEKYEIAHDILAQPILDWRIRHTHRRQQELEELRFREEAALKQREQQLEIENAHKIAEIERQRYEVERRSAQRLRWMMALQVVAWPIAIIVLRLPEIRQASRPGDGGGTVNERAAEREGGRRSDGSLRRRRRWQPRKANDGRGGQRVDDCRDLKNSRTAATRSRG
jgi:hypothetical protein